MAIHVINQFSSYNLSPEEQLEGQKLTVAQVRVLQNLLASYAEEKIHLTVDPTNVNIFLQQEADLKGKIDVLTYILDLSEASKEIPDVEM